MSEPFFSIILPTYNRAGFIAKAIQSVLAQTFTSFELVIIDDGSTDDTAQLVGSFNDPRIIYIHQDNREKSAARNAGLKKAKGKYICFIDSDDHYLNDHLQSFFEEIGKRNHPLAVLYAHVIRENNGVQENERVGEYEPLSEFSTQQNRVAEYLLFYSPLVQASCFHRDIFIKNEFNTELKVTECYELMGRVAIEFPFIKIEKRSAVIVGHGKNSTTFGPQFLLRYEKEWNMILSSSEFLFLKETSLYKKKMSNIYLGLGNFFINDSKKKEASDYLKKTRELDPLFFLNRQYMGLFKKYFFLENKNRIRPCVESEDILI